MKQPATNQRGSMLLEALIAILIFSMGILAIVGLQAASIRLSSDAKYRTDAIMLANEIIGRMWVADRTPATLQGNFQGGQGTNGAEYTRWAAKVFAALPGASGVNQPTITVAPVIGTDSTSAQVTVTVFWNLPGEPLENRHNAMAIAQIR